MTGGGKKAEAGGEVGSEDVGEVQEAGGDK